MSKGIKNVIVSDINIRIMTSLLILTEKNHTIGFDYKTSERKMLKKLTLNKYINIVKPDDLMRNYDGSPKMMTMAMLDMLMIILMILI